MLALQERDDCFKDPARLKSSGVFLGVRLVVAPRPIVAHPVRAIVMVRNLVDECREGVKVFSQ
jgi:hypothetical protein